MQKNGGVKVDGVPPTRCFRKGNSMSEINVERVYPMSTTFEQVDGMIYPLSNNNLTTILDILYLCDGKFEKHSFL